jgi:hypothetical protein
MKVAKIVQFDKRMRRKYGMFGARGVHCSTIGEL